MAGEGDLDAALERGLDELHGHLEWALRDYPRALVRVRERYRRWAMTLYREIERARRQQGQ